MQRILAIQEHDARRVGLHWDLRFENDDIFISFVIPKARLPEVHEKLLAIPVEDHSYECAKFEGEYTEGYGAGTVKLIYFAPVEVAKFEDNKIQFMYNENNYTLFKFQKNWLITQKTKVLQLRLKTK